MPRIWLQITAIIAITIAVYMNAPQGQFMNIDDNLLVYNNPKVQELNLANLKEIFTTFDPELYIPFTLLSYQLEYHFAGENPSVFHATNVVLHLLNALLVFALIRFFSKKWFVPFTAAVLFAIHPINTETVMWISARKDLLSTFFFLGSLVMYCRFKTLGTRHSLYGSLGLFVCALMSKIIAVSLPLVLLLIDDMLPSKEHADSKLHLWAFGIPALLFLGVGMMGKKLTIFVLGYFESILLACKGVYFYFAKILIPTDLSLAYEQITPIELLQQDFLFPVLILIAVAVIAIASRAFGKTFSFCMMWFALTLLPNLGNAVKGIEGSIYFASDRYVYIPSIGIFFAVACGVAWLLEESSQKKQVAISIATIFVIGTYGLMARNYSIEWLNPKRYHERTVKIYPESLLHRVLLGMSYVREEKNEEALPHFQKAVERKPNYANPLAHLGLTLVKIGEVDRGIAALEEALEMNATHSYSHVYLSYAYILKDNRAKSRELLDTALAKKPENPKILQMYGVLEHGIGNLEEAENYYRRSLSFDPTSIQAKAALAKVLRDK